MHDYSDTEIEMYEEVVGELDFNMPVNTQIPSTVPVASAPTVGTTLYDSIIIDSIEDSMSKLLICSPKPCGPTREMTSYPRH